MPDRPYPRQPANTVPVPADSKPPPRHRFRAADLQPRSEISQSMPQSLGWSFPVPLVSPCAVGGPQIFPNVTAKDICHKPSAPEIHPDAFLCIPTSALREPCGPSLFEMRSRARALFLERKILPQPDLRPAPRGESRNRHCRFIAVNALRDTIEGRHYVVISRAWGDRSIRKFSAAHSRG